MRTLRPPYSRTDKLGEPQCFCATCDAYRPRTEFYATALNKRARCCKACWSQKQRHRRSATVVARMLYSVKNRLRRRGHHELARAWERTDVEDLLRRHGHRTVPPSTGLCLVAIDPSVPLRPDNARIVPTRVACGRHHRRRRPGRQKNIMDRLGPPRPLVHL